MPGTPAPPAAPTQDKKPFLGKSVQNGIIRYSSVSQIVIFDPNQEGGCNRRWWFIYVGGFKEEKSEAQLAGNHHAKALEHYLKTGEDVLTPELRAAKHLLPKPGPDIEAEKDLGPNIARAIALREHIIKTGDKSRLTMDALVDAAGLTACGVPLMGAYDFRHRRGEYLDENGTMRKEAPGHVVVETGDLKTTSQLLDRVSQPRGSNPGGKIYPGRMKTVEQILAHPQMLGYGVCSLHDYPESTHVRLGHIGVQTKGALLGIKRTGLLEAGEVQHRWTTRVEPIMGQMLDAAKATRYSDLPANLKSCIQFNKPCQHADRCDRSGITTIADLVRTPPGAPRLASPAPLALPPSVQGVRMASLFDMTSDLSTSDGPPPLPVAASPVLSDDAHKAATEAAKQKILEQERIAAEAAKNKASRVGCGAPGCGVGCIGGYTVSPSGPSAFLMCSACGGKGKVVDPRPQHIGSVNPPDRPGPNAIENISPLPTDVVAAISDPQLRAQAEAHASAHAAKAAADAAASPAAAKTSGRCPGGGQMITLTPQVAASRKATCPGCGEVRPLKKFTEAELAAGQVAMPGHNRPKSAAAEAGEAKPEPAAAAASVARGNAPSSGPTIITTPATGSAGASPTSEVMMDDDLPPPLPTDQVVSGDEDGPPPLPGSLFSELTGEAKPYLAPDALPKQQPLPVVTQVPAAAASASVSSPVPSAPPVVTVSAGPAVVMAPIASVVQPGPVMDHLMEMKSVIARIQKVLDGASGILALDEGMARQLLAKATSDSDHLRAILRVVSGV